MTARGGGLWGLRTNLFRQGQCGAATGWSQSGGGVVARAVDATVPAPFSLRSIKVTTDGAAANQGCAAASAAGQAAVAGSMGVGSVYLKGAAAGLAYRVQMWWVNTDASNTFGTVTNVTSSGGWQLLTPPVLAVIAAKTGNTLLINITINGTRAESFWLAHAMLESSVNQVSPYIPTNGATASRQGGRRWQQENERRIMHRYAQVWP